MLDRPFWPSAFVLILYALTPSAGAQSTRPTAAGFNSATAELALRDAPFTVWTQSEVVPGTERSVVLTYVVRYFVRKDDGAATLTWTFRGTHVPAPAAVMEDGTLFLTETNDLIKAAPGHEAVVVDLTVGGKTFAPLAVFRDGVVIQSTDLNTVQPIYFAPMKEGRLDLAARIRVTDATGLPVNSRQTFMRLGDRLVWMSHTGRHTAEGPPYSLLHTFDVNTKKLREFSFDHTEILRGLDRVAGNVAILDGGRFNLDTGKLTPADPP